MGQKVFITRDKYTLMSDERDFVIPVKHRMEVIEWCQQFDIKAEIPLDELNRHLTHTYFGVDLWRVKDDEQRLMFALKWS
jgi:hypothetical protein